ncbi:hypothetical protein O6D91_21050 [Cronobacter sakazakii]|uniref:hypothetical protein n=1 Tax=Cronobacter sakazakii TaxID=28141 RepID=UPI0022B3859A|nr:hypothetical protein [Cronobacter sakazakii]MCZ6132194.1 hypothetical protein [Cronobacter sakazakii]
MVITIKAAPKNTRERVSKHRAKLKEQGGKVVTLDLEAEELALIGVSLDIENYCTLR